MIRIVKMTFEEEKIDDFLRLFEETKEKIRKQPGCKGLKLIRNLHNSNMFFTISIWDDEKSLELYRNSDLFKTVWSKTKKMFSEKPEAWSTKEIFCLE